MLRVLAIGLCLLFVGSGSSVGEERGSEKIPAKDVENAHTYYRARIVPHPVLLESDPVYAENLLRIFALTAPDAVVDGNLAWVRESDWETGFKETFARAIRWARDVRDMSADGLYGLSLGERERNGRGFLLVAKKLRDMAAERGSVAARREVERADRSLDPRGLWTPYMLELLKADIERGDPASMALMAYRYEKGEGTKVDLAKAYYRYLRAEQLDPGIDATRESVGRKASDKERLQALRWLAEGKPPEF